MRFERLERLPLEYIPSEEFARVCAGEQEHAVLGPGPQSTKHAEDLGARWAAALLGEPV